jgi:hypothetical protein
MGVRDGYASRYPWLARVFNIGQALLASPNIGGTKRCSIAAAKIIEGRRKTDNSMLKVGKIKTRKMN